MIGAYVRTRIMNLLDENNLSARQLSLDIGKNESYLSNIFQRKKIPPIEVLKDICDRFNITLPDFFAGAYEGEPYLQPIYQEMTRLLDGCSDSDTILNMLRTFDKEDVEFIIKYIKKNKRNHERK